MGPLRQDKVNFGFLCGGWTVDGFEFGSYLYAKNDAQFEVLGNEESKEEGYGGCEEDTDFCERVSRDDLDCS
jgi:hypothetical protein